MTTTATPTPTPAPVGLDPAAPDGFASAGWRPDVSARTVERFQRCFEQQHFDELATLYRGDATFELLVGSTHERRTGRDAIVARYVGDYDPPPTFLRWEARLAPWGAIVEGDAVQGDGAARGRFRWVHVLTIEDDLIVDDTVYCTGWVPHPEGGR